MVCQPVAILLSLGHGPLFAMPGAAWRPRRQLPLGLGRIRTETAAPGLRQLEAGWVNWHRSTAFIAGWPTLSSLLHERFPPRKIPPFQRKAAAASSQALAHQCQAIPCQAATALNSSVFAGLTDPHSTADGPRGAFPLPPGRTHPARCSRPSRQTGSPRPRSADSGTTDSGTTGCRMNRWVSPPSPSVGRWPERREFLAADCSGEVDISADVHARLLFVSPLVQALFLAHPRFRCAP